MGFGLMTRFIGHFDTLHDYALHFTITHTHPVTFSLVGVWYRLPTSDVSFLWVSELRPQPQLLTAMAHNDGTQVVI
jgi:hypothetical protein